MLVCVVRPDGSSSLVVSLRGGEKGQVVSTFTNPSSWTISVLKWHTPLEGHLTYDTFSITDAQTGQTLEYEGMMVKRGDPDASSFVELPAGQSLTATTDLTESYPLQKGHRYTIRIKSNVVILAGNLPASLPTLSTLPDWQPLTSNSVDLKF